MAHIITAEQAAQLIPDAATVTVSSSSGLGCPDHMLAAIGERFAASGAPRDLTMLHPIAAGDMYGVKGVDHIARPGLIKTIIGGSYPSGPSSLPMPEIWRMVVDNQVAAYNAPSGVLFDMHRDAAARRPGVLTKVGMDTFVDPIHQGCAMNAKAAERPIVRRVEFDGETWLHFAPIKPDVAIIRATTADERGNLSYEHEGAYLGARDQALAARNCGGVVIAQVKRVTRAGALNPQHVHAPGVLVDYVVVAPEQWQTTQTVYDPAISGETQRPDDAFCGPEWGVEKVIARRAAQELRRGDAVNIGFGISANVPLVLFEEGRHGDVTWVIEQGAVGGLPLTGFQFGCAANAEAITPSPTLFTYFQGGGFDASLLSFLQIGRNGDINVSKLAGRPYLTAGLGGFVDITAHARRIVFSGHFTVAAKVVVEDGAVRIAREGEIKKLVRRVEQISFSGARARELGQHVTFITDRCVMRLAEDGLDVVEIAPGVDVERDILLMAEFPLRVAENARRMDAALFRPEPIGLDLREAAK